MSRSLVIRGGAIGDFLLTLPAISALREAFHGSSVDMIGYSHIGEFARSIGCVSEVHSIENAALARFFGRNTELDSGICEVLAGYDRIISYLYDPDSLFEANLHRAGAKKVVSWDPRPVGGIHAAKWMLRGLEALGVVGARPWVRFGEPRMMSTLGGDIVIHPGSGSKRKNWPIANWVALSEALLSGGHRVTVVGGEADREELDAFAKRRCEGLSVLDSLSLSGVAGVIGKAAFFLGHDSGIGHLAATVGTRCVLLFGPTDPGVWAPLHPWVKIVRALGGDMGNICLRDVLEAMDDGRECPR